MINKILKFLIPKYQSDLEVVLSKIDAQKEVRSANILMSMSGAVVKLDMSKDLHFMVGTVKYFPCKIFDHFVVKFNNNDEKCIVTLQYDNDPLFIFSNTQEVSQIKKAIIDKYNKFEGI